MDSAPTSWKKTFFVIWSGQAVSLLGSSAAQFAIIWWLTVQSGSAAVLATASLAGFLPQALIGPFAGAWVDRMSRKTVMIAADLAIAVASVLLAVAFLLGTPPTWFVYAILAWRAAGAVFHAPAMQAAMPLLVPASELTRTASWSQFLQSSSFMAGPVLGAALMAAFTMPAVMLMDVLGALLAVTSLAVVAIPDPPALAGQRQHILRELADGLRIIGEERSLRSALLPIMLVVLVFVPVGSLIPLMVSDHFDGTAWHASTVEFMFAGGMLVSSLVLGVWGGSKNRLSMIAISIWVVGMMLALSGLLPPEAFAAFAVLAGLMGAAGNVFSVSYIALVQSSVPPEALGRVFSLLGSITAMATPVGLLIAGPVAESIGVPAWFTLSGTLILTTGAAYYLLQRRRLAEVEATVEVD